MPNNPSKQAALVGAGESDQIGYVPDKTSMMLHAEAIRAAAADAGIQISDIEAVFAAGGVGGMTSVGLAEYLGIKPKYFDSTTTGGSIFVMYVHHALAAINAGIIDIAVISHGESGYSGGRRGGRGTGGGRGAGDPWSPGAQFESPYGLAGPPSSYSHAMNRYMHQFRRDVGGLRADRGHHPRVGGAEPEGGDALVRDELPTAGRSPFRTCWTRASSRGRCTCSTAAWSPTTAGR